MSTILLKAKYSFISALVFFIVSNPETYKFIQNLAGSFITITTDKGAVTPNGLLFQTVIFFLAMWGLMMVPTK